jgi:hypothetical protein
VLGFARLPEQHIAEAVRLLAEAAATGLGTTARRAGIRTARRLCSCSRCCWKGGGLVDPPGPGEPLPGDRRPADLGEDRGVITTTLLSGIIAVAVASAEWTASGQALSSRTGILWSVVAPASWRQPWAATTTPSGTCARHAT